MDNGKEKGNYYRVYGSGFDFGFRFGPKPRDQKPAP